jgi:hypothetical protein
MEALGSNPAWLGMHAVSDVYGRHYGDFEPPHGACIDVDHPGHDMLVRVCKRLAYMLNGNVYDFDHPNR